MKRMFLACVALALVAWACGDSEPGTVHTTTAPPANQAVKAAATGLQTSITPYGQLLADADRHSLYLFTVDSDGVSACYDECSAQWPPLLAADVGEPGDGIDRVKIGSVVRADGTVQATYNGHPLYRFSGDAQPGQLAGHGIGDVWFAVTTAGEPAALEPSTPSGYGY